MSRLAVITMIENPLNWESRYRNYHIFRGLIEKSSARLYTVEVQYKNKGHIRRIDAEDVLHLTTESEMWHKENALNLLLQRVEEEYVMWADADIMFCNPHWVNDTLEQLQHYKVVQPFSHMQNLGASFQPIGCIRPSYMYQYKTEGEIYGGVNFWGKSKIKIPPERNAHPGLCWAASKKTLSDIGGLIDWCVAGSGDFHMVAAFLGRLVDVIDGYTSSYKSKCVVWESKCSEFVKDNVGYVPGLICHFWHGSVLNRKYTTYQNILKDTCYDPDFDIKRNWQGLYEWTGINPTLEKAVSTYLRSRNEDEIGEVLIP